MLGYLWTLVRPLLLFGVIWVFFTQVGHVNDASQPGMEQYGSQLLGSIVLFTFFAEATGGAVRSMVDRENMLRKIHFPRLVIPASVVLLAMFNLGLNLIVWLIFALASGVRADGQLAGAAADPRRAGARHRRGGDAALGAVRALPRHAADLGSDPADPVLRLAGDHLDPDRRKRLRRDRCCTSTCSTRWR